MAKSAYSQKVLEMVAKEIGDYFTGLKIVEILIDFGMTRESIQYPNTKWWTINEAFKYIKANYEDPDNSITKLIMEFLHPLNHGLKNEVARKLAGSVGKCLEYDNFRIEDTGKEYIILSLVEMEALDETVPKQKEKPERLPDTNKSTYSERVVELVSKEFSEALENWDIVKIVDPILKKNVALFEENTIKSYVEQRLEKYPFETLNDVLQVVRRRDENADRTISDIIEALLHPLNYEADENRVNRIVGNIRKYIKYNGFVIHDMEDEYKVFSATEIGKMMGPDPELMAFVEKGEAEYEQKIKDEKEAVKKMRDNHQAYMDVLEIFCKNTKKPTKELNDAYLFLAQKIGETMAKLNLNYFMIELYRPFQKDLYTAEIEWSSEPDELSWDAIRPGLNKVHGDILRICNLAEEDLSMTDDEKKLEDINILISKKLAEQSAKDLEVNKGKITKIEISKMPDLNIRNVDDNLLVKNKKKIGLPKLPRTDWGKVEIRFINETTVYIKADKKTATVDYEGLGFNNEKKDKPNTAWYFLLELAKTGGETPIIESPIPDKIKQHKRTIADRLKTIFKNDTDPFYDFSETNTYKIKIALIPPVKETVSDALGIDEYLKDATSGYEEE